MCMLQNRFKEFRREKCKRKTSSESSLDSLLQSSPKRRPSSFTCAEITPPPGILLL